MTIGKTDAGTFGLSVALHIQRPGVDRIKAEQVVAAAHQRCPHSNATRALASIFQPCRARSIRGCDSNSGSKCQFRHGPATEVISWSASRVPRSCHYFSIDFVEIAL